MGRQDSQGLVKLLVPGQGCRWRCGPGRQHREGSAGWAVGGKQASSALADTWDGGPGHSYSFPSTDTQYLDGLPGNKRA